MTTLHAVAISANKRAGRSFNVVIEQLLAWWRIAIEEKGSVESSKAHQCTGLHTQGANI